MFRCETCGDSYAYGTGPICSYCTSNSTLFGTKNYDYTCSICKEWKYSKVDPYISYPGTRCCQSCFHNVGSLGEYWRCEQCRSLYFGNGYDKLEGFVILEGRVYCFNCMTNPKLPSALNYIQDVQISLPISDMPENGRYVDLS